MTIFLRLAREAEEKQQENQESKRTTGTNEDRMSWPVPEGLAPGSRRAQNLHVREEQPCAISW